MPRISLDSLTPFHKRNLVYGAKPVTIAICMLMAVYFGVLFYRGKYQDWFHLYHGMRAVVQGTDPYAAGQQGYIYPPFFAVVFAPLGMLEQGISGLIFAVISGVMMVSALWLIARETCRLLGVGTEPWRVWTVTFSGLALNADKLRAVLYSGQSDNFVMLCLAGGLALARRFPFMAGVCVGLASVVKYQSLIFLPYFIVRRRWMEAAGTVSGFVGGLLVGVPVFGWQTNLTYVGRSFRGLLAMVGIQTSDATPVHELTWWASVSVASALARMTHYPENKGLFVALYGAVAVACVVIGWWLLRRAGETMFVGRGGAPERTLERGVVTCVEWAGLIIAIIVLSPQSVGRHFVLAVFPLILLGCVLLHPRVGVSRFWPIAGLVLYIAGLTLPPGNTSFEPWLRAWKHIGGASWCTLIMFFLLMAHVLKWKRAAAPVSA